MGAPDGPFVVLLEQDRSDEAEALDRVGGSLVLAKTYLLPDTGLF